MTVVVVVLVVASCSLGSKVLLGLLIVLHVLGLVVTRLVVGQDQVLSRDLLVGQDQVLSGPTTWSPGLSVSGHQGPPAYSRAPGPPS